MKMKVSDAINLILNAMRSFAENVFDQKPCLAEISSFREGSVKSQRLKGKSGGVDLVLTAMKAFMENEKAMACVALRRLPLDAENRESLGVNGGNIALIESRKSLGSESENNVHVLYVVRTHFQTQYLTTQNVSHVCHAAEKLR